MVAGTNWSKAWLPMGSSPAKARRYSVRSRLAWSSSRPVPSRLASDDEFRALCHDHAEVAGAIAGSAARPAGVRPEELRLLLVELDEDIAVHLRRALDEGQWRSVN